LQSAASESAANESPSQLFSFCIVGGLFSVSNSVSKLSIYHRMQRIQSAYRLGVSAGRAAQGAGDPAGGTLPRGHAGVGIGGRPHSARGTATCRRGHWRQASAGNGPGGMYTCRLRVRAATGRWSFLAKKFTGGPFRQFIGTGSLICQKFNFLIHHELSALQYFSNNLVISQYDYLQKVIL
jgi:hypothetical protein